MLDLESPTSAIVFCRTRIEVDELTETLQAHGYRSEAVHGGLSQRERDRVMNLFRGGKTDLLVATDVAARGLDISRVSHVFNYDVPSAAEGYLHRIGRTGRVGRSGVAITLAEPREQRLLRNIEAFTKQKIEVASVRRGRHAARRIGRTREATGSASSPAISRTWPGRRVLARVRRHGVAAAAVRWSTPRRAPRGTAEFRLRSMPREGSVPRGAREIHPAAGALPGAPREG